jgi:hypothetical protein
MEWRSNARARLRADVSLAGTDSGGSPFQISGESVDISRKGMGVVLEQAAVTPGAVVTVTGSMRFEATAVVQWSRPAAGGRQDIGLKFLRYRAGIGLRVAASILLCIAILGQAGYGRSRPGRGGSRPRRPVP